MKIGLFVPTHNPLPTPPGRIWAPGIMVFNLAEGLAKKGHKVYIFASQDSIVPEGCTLIQTNIYSIFHDYPTLREDNFAKFTELFAMYDLAVLSYVKQTVNDLELDVVHFHDMRRELFLNNDFGTATAYTFHANPDPVYSKWLQYSSEKFKRKINLFALTKFHASNFEKYFDDIKIIGNGIETDKFAFNPVGSEEYLFAGRIIPSKGTFDAVKATSQNDKVIDLVGSKGDTKEDIEYYQKVTELASKGLVKYLGVASRDDMPAIYSKAKALVFPLRGLESFGLTMIESMSCGTPVIAYDRGPVKEIIKNGETGFVVEADNIDMLRDAIKKMSSIPEDEYRKMRQNCRNHVEKYFSTDVMVNNYEKNYQEIMQ